MDLHLEPRALLARGQYQRARVFVDVDHHGATRHRRCGGFDAHVIMDVIAVRVLTIGVVFVG
jgi:hypothetical protein